jgi:hypothetical protein
MVSIMVLTDTDNVILANDLLKCYYTINEAVRLIQNMDSIKDKNTIEFEMALLEVHDLLYSRLSGDK